MSSKLNIGVIFGSRSVEHDVSVVSAMQVIQALDPTRYNVIPIYITREGRWYTGENLKAIRNFNIDDIAQLVGTKETHLSSNVHFPGIITPPLAGRLSKNVFQKLDVVFPVIHGSHGEDGTLQGLFEMANLPYVGTGVLASAVANDKAMTKTVLQARGIPIIERYVEFTRHEWAQNRAALLERIAAEVGFPAFVKPVTLGSSIGIARVEDSERTALHIDIASNLDARILVERAAEGNHIVEINAAVLGADEIRASALEQPISYKEFLDYEEKYMRGGAKGMKGQQRLIPAPIDADVTAKIKQAAVDAFKAIRGKGTARIDFLLDTDSGQFWLNEINTMPGSLAFYLWEPEGMTPSAVCDELITLALAVHAEKQHNTYNYKSGLIELAAKRGSKGAKGGKLG